MGRKRRQGNMTPQKAKNNLVEDYMESEGGESSVADLRRMMIRISMSSKRSLKKIYKKSSMNIKRTGIQNSRRHINN
jgi:hypothetical protein